MNVCVFAGSSSGARASYREAATALGTAIAGRGMGLVYGGASVGLMGAAADAALAAGGRVVGVLPSWLDRREIAHTGLTELRVVSSMHERKALMADMADMFAVLPGGIGSLEECFEVWTWTQLGIHKKPIGLLNVEGYYDALERFLDQVVTESFLRAEHRGLLCSAPAADELLDLLSAAELPDLEKWLDDVR